MNRTDHQKTKAKTATGGLSVIVMFIFLVALFIIGAASISHSYPAVNHELNKAWLAAKQVLSSMPDFGLGQRQSVLESPAGQDGTQSGSEPVVDESALERLMTHPVCRPIYLAEYLPTFNAHAITKCEEYIVRHEKNQLFGEYIDQICSTPLKSSLTRQQIGEIQLRLRKYASVFPQTEILIEESDVDGLYGKRSCQMIATYQIVTNFTVVDGIADSLIYNSLASAIALDEDELATISWPLTPPSVNKKNPPSREKKTVVASKKQQIQPPTNPFKRIAFCLRNPSNEQCIAAGSQSVVSDRVPSLFINSNAEDTSASQVASLSNVPQQPPSISPSNPLIFDPIIKRGVNAYDVNRIQMALGFVKEKQYQRAINIITPLANSRNPDARYRLALMVKQGLGTRERPKFAFSLAKLAAEQGHPHAKRLLGQFYQQGYGTKANQKEAAKWL